MPINNSFLYVEPIYIQASQASMPQLKKVALAMGNLLAYADTYEQALAQLIGMSGATEPANSRPAVENATANAAPSVNSVNPPTRPPTNQPEQTLQQIRAHLQRYKDLSAQGKWADAGRELDEIQRLVQKQ
ncbi:MAG: hypothetical protein JO051_02205 [Acidobacteriaceae bacterium]|nr:hypothetical protein [Acidobacteriaceae bacterium]